MLLILGMEVKSIFLPVFLESHQSSVNQSFCYFCYLSKLLLSLCEIELILFLEPSHS